MRKPDLIIGPRHDPQTLRWQLFKFRGWQLCLHKWLRSDDDRALHDHSGDSLSIILKGEYTEMPDRQVYGVGNVIFRKAEKLHRIVLGESKPVWTLWFRWPPRREWGFYCPDGWKHWRDYLNNRGDYYADGTSEVGPGCG